MKGRRKSIAQQGRQHVKRKLRELDEIQREAAQEVHRLQFKLATKERHVAALEEALQESHREFREQLNTQVYFEDELNRIRMHRKELWAQSDYWRDAAERRQRLLNGYRGQNEYLRDQNRHLWQYLAGFGAIIAILSTFIAMSPAI